MSAAIENDNIEVKSAQSLFELMLAIAKYTGDKFNDAAALDSACTKYIDKYKERYGVVKILGMSRPVRLDNIYTELKLLSPEYLNRFSTIDDLQALFLEKHERGLAGYNYQRDKPVSGLDIANSKKMQFFNLLGAPGSGKSTFLRYVGLMALKSYRRSITGQLVKSVNKQPYKFNLIPVLIELNRFEKGNLNLLNHIDYELSTCGFPKGFAAAALEHGAMLILLDGVDEIPTKVLTRGIRSIKDFISRYDKNRYITSCRTAFYKTWFTNFYDYIIADFTNDQIKAFIQNWFTTDGTTEQAGRELWKMLDHEHNEPMLELARTPLLAAFIAMTYESTGNMPMNRAELYGESLRIIIEKWSATRRTHLGPVCEGLYGRNYLSMLEMLAGPAFQNGQYFFNAGQLATEIENYVKTGANAPKSIDGAKILAEIEKKQGLIIQRARNLYSFSHLTIQEYLSSCYYYKHGKWGDILSKYLTNDHWREVIILMSGLFDPSSDDYLDAISRSVKAVYLKDSSKSIHALFEWASKTANAKAGSESNILRRVLLINIFLKSLNDTNVVRGIARQEAKGMALEIDDIIDYENDYYDGKYNATSTLLTSLINIIYRSLTAVDGVKDAIIGTGGSLVTHEYIDDMMYGHIAIETIEFIDRYHIVNPRTAKKLAKAKRELLLKDNVIGADNTIDNYKLLFDALGLPKRLWRFSSSALVIVNEYLRAAIRLYECKESALRVTYDGWQRNVGLLFSQ